MIGTVIVTIAYSNVGARFSSCLLDRSASVEPNEPVVVDHQARPGIRSLRDSGDLYHHLHGLSRCHRDLAAPRRRRGRWISRIWRV